MKFASEIELLKALAAGDAQGLGRRFLAKEVDLHQLGKFLYDEQLGIYFHALAEEQRLLMLLPRNMRDQLLWLRDDQRRRNESLLGTTQQVLAQLADAAVEPMFLKGLPLAQQYWGGTDHRFCWDIDMLVREADRKRAINTLKAEGYKSTSPAFLPLALSFSLSHAMEFHAGGVPVDLHWNFRQRPGFTIDYEAVWRRSTVWQAAGMR